MSVIEHKPLEAVTPLCESLDLTVDVIDTAAAYYLRAQSEHPINRTPRVVAAGSVYLAAMMENEKVSQQAVSEQSGVSVGSIRDAYLEIADHEGLRQRVEPTDADVLEPTNPIDRFVDRVVIRGDCAVEPCASKGWIKMRALAVGIGAAVPGLFIMNQGFDTVGIIVAFASLYLAIRIVSTRINQRIERGHTCEVLG